MNNSLSSSIFFFLLLWSHQSLLCSAKKLSHQRHLRSSQTAQTDEPLKPSVELDVLPMKDEQGRLFMTGRIIVGILEYPLIITSINSDGPLNLQVELDVEEFRGIQAIVSRGGQEVRIQSSDIDHLETTMRSPVDIFGIFGREGEIGNPTELGGGLRQRKRHLEESIISAASVVSAGLAIGLAAIGPEDGNGGGRKRRAVSVERSLPFILSEDDHTDPDLVISSSAFVNAETLYGVITSLALQQPNLNRRRKLTFHDEKDSMVRFDVEMN